MQNTTITFTKPGRAELLTSEVREPAANEVLVRLAVSTISSGTERANLIGEVNIGIGKVPPQPQFPRISGYSSAGTVEKVGSAVRSVQVGERVALSWSIHSRYCLVDERNVHRILSDTISFQEAALWHISTFPAAAIRKCRLEFGEAALVMGAGVLGLMAVRLLRAAGAVPVIAADPVAERRECALRHGADYALDPFDPAFAQRVRQLTDGGPQVAIEVTGNGGGLNGALDCMRPFGRVALLGCTRHSDFSVDYYKKVHGPGIELIGAHTLARPQQESRPGCWTTHDDVMAVQRLVLGRRLQLQPLVEELHSPQEASAVYDRLAAGGTFPVVQFDWRDME